MFDFIEDEGQRQQAIAQFEETRKADEEKWSELTTQKITEATTGLQNKNTELLTEKKKLQERFKDIKDPQEALEALRLVNENAEIRMIREGKVDELIALKTDGIRSDYDAKIGELTGMLETERKTGSQYKTMFHTKMVEDTLRDAAMVAKIRPEAIPDVIMRGMNVFSLGDDNKTVEARDSHGKLIKIDEGTKILTPSLFIDQLKRTAPHFWPQSESAKFDTASGTELEELEAAMNAAADRGDSVEYRRLRNKLNAATKK